MELNLESKIGSAPGVGTKTEGKLNKLGVLTIRDLFFNFPRKYLDFTKTTKIADLSQNGESFTVKGNILAIENKKTRRRGFTVTEAMVIDGSGSLKVVWFNQPFLAKMLREGSKVILNGRVTYDGYSGGFVMESPIRTNRPQIIAVYPEVAGISSFFIGKLVNSLKLLITKTEEWLPQEFLIKSQSPNDQFESGGGLKLLPLHDALLNIHQPKDTQMLEKARRRFAFDELFFISLRANIAKEEIKRHTAVSIEVNHDEMERFTNKLPFGLTDDQKKAAEAILNDLGQSVPMNRLLNGDVGSGKTVVAAIAANAVMLSAHKTILMVPTSILAVQHYKTFCGLFSQNDVSIGLLTSECQDCNQIAKSKLQISNKNPNSKNQKSKEKLDHKFCILSSDIIIGTQALIQEGVNIDNIGLVIVDEQHRFGVGQRAAVHELNSGKLKPHFLSMTATPIPRTLRLALFGDLDISVISEKPANRKEIKTRFVQPFNREKAYAFIREHLKAGRQVFVICPLIEENKDLEFNDKDSISLFDEDRKSVLSEFEKLKKIFPEFEIGMLHGKMKGREKDEIMAKFAKNEINMLVSTSVVEVGVDVPNATIMMIEDAERFGLSQLHQFRGRVGRGEHQSFCFLFSNSKSEKSIQRLCGIEEINDGFKLAELDLEIRGPGAIFGTEQSGMLDLKMASLSDRNLIEQASEAAKKIAPEIDKYPKLKEKISRYFVNKHLE